MFVTGCSRAPGVLVSVSERFCAAAWLPGGYVAVTLSTRLLPEEVGLGAWAEGPCAGAPASNSSLSTLCQL